MLFLLFLAFDLIIERKNDPLSDRNIFIAIGLLMAFMALVSGLIAFAVLRKKK
jgi:hypothetical protein